MQLLLTLIGIGIRGVTIHIPCDSIQFRLVPFDFDYFDSIVCMFLNSYNIAGNVNNMQP